MLNNIMWALKWSSPKIKRETETARDMDTV